MEQEEIAEVDVNESVSDNSDSDSTVGTDSAGERNEENGTGEAGEIEQTEEIAEVEVNESVSDSTDSDGIDDTVPVDAERTESSAESEISSESVSDEQSDVREIESTGEGTSEDRAGEEGTVESSETTQEESQVSETEQPGTESGSSGEQSEVECTVCIDYQTYFEQQHADMMQIHYDLGVICSLLLIIIIYGVCKLSYRFFRLFF